MRGIKIEKIKEDPTAVERTRDSLKDLCGSEKVSFENLKKQTLSQWLNEVDIRSEITFVKSKDVESLQNTLKEVMKRKAIVITPEVYKGLLEITFENTLPKQRMALSSANYVIHGLISNGGFTSKISTDTKRRRMRNDE